MIDTAVGPRVKSPVYIFFFFSVMKKITGHLLCVCVLCLREREKERERIVFTFTNKFHSNRK